jgi:hypothetical protein
MPNEGEDNKGFLSVRLYTNLGRDDVPHDSVSIYDLCDPLGMTLKPSGPYTTVYQGKARIVLLGELPVPPVSLPGFRAHPYNIGI